MPTEKMKKLKNECFQYFAEDLLQDSFDISQISLLPNHHLHNALMTEKNVFKTQKSPTLKNKREADSDPQMPQGKFKKIKCAKFDDFQVKEIQENLGAECPVFVKSMVPTNVARGFFLTLQQKFCELHLLLHDTRVTLEDGSGKEYRINFLVEHRILSGGWRRFCIENRLVVGDLLVFRLVRPLKFKVYTLGTHSLTEANIAFSLLQLGACANQTQSVGNSPTCHPGDVFEGNIHKTSVTLENPKPSDSQYIKELSSNIPKGFEFPAPAFGFEDVRSLESFTILVNGVKINSRLSKQHKKYYYDLCCSQRSFLHNHLLKSISSKLAAEIIIETTNIANAVRAGKLSTVHGDITMWEKTLNAFEILCMNVEFLRAQLRQLLSLSFKSSKHSKLEQACAKEEVTTFLPSNCSELEGRMVIVDSKMQALNHVAKTHELLQEEADAVNPLS